MFPISRWFPLPRTPPFAALQPGPAGASGTAADWHPVTAHLRAVHRIKSVQREQYRAPLMHADRPGLFMQRQMLPLSYTAEDSICGHSSLHLFVNMKCHRIYCG